MVQRIQKGSIHPAEKVKIVHQSVKLIRRMNPEDSNFAKWKNVLDQLLEKGPGNKPDNCWNYKDYKRSKSEKKEMEQEYKRTYKKKKDESSFDPKKISYKGTFI